MKTRPVTVEFFHPNVRTDMTNLTVAFRNLENAPKKNSLVGTEMRDLRVEATGSSETSVRIQQNKLCHISEERQLFPATESLHAQLRHVDRTSNLLYRKFH